MVYSMRTTSLFWFLGQFGDLSIVQIPNNDHSKRNRDDQYTVCKYRNCYLGCTKHQQILSYYTSFASSDFAMEHADSSRTSQVTAVSPASQS